MRRHGGTEIVTPSNTIPTLAADKDQETCGVLEDGGVHSDGDDDGDESQ